MNTEIKDIKSIDIGALVERYDVSYRVITINTQQGVIEITLVADEAESLRISL